MELESLHKYIILLTDIQTIKIRNLQSMLFTLSHSIKEMEGQTSFDIGCNGPYCDIVDEEITYLAQEGILTVNDTDISLTDKGKKLLKGLEMDVKTMKTLRRHYDFFDGMSDREIKSYFYLACSDMVEESDYTGHKRFLNNDIFSLIKKEKITAERGSELLNKNILEIRAEMKARKIPF